MTCLFTRHSFSRRTAGWLLMYSCYHDTRACLTMLVTLMRESGAGVYTYFVTGHTTLLRDSATPTDKTHPLIQKDTLLSLESVAALHTI